MNRFQVALFLIALCACSEGVKMSAQSAPAKLELPRIVTEAEPRYLLGFPLLVAVTFDNRNNKDAEFYDIPDLSVFYGHGTLGVRLAAVGGGEAREIKPSLMEEDRRGVTLSAGERKTMLVDLSNFGLDIHAGQYDLTVTLRVAAQQRSSEAVRITFAAASPTDATEAARLRGLGGPQGSHGAWSPFLTANRSTVRSSPQLSPEATAQLALHLFLHYAIYGPRGVGQLGLDQLKHIRQPSLAAEVAAMAFEIRAAQLDEAGRKALLETVANRWPGIRYRLEPVLAAEGFLAGYRQGLGPDSPFARPGAPAPYRE
jgi:hypothetical protein